MQMPTFNALDYSEASKLAWMPLTPGAFRKSLLKLILLHDLLCYDMESGLDDDYEMLPEADTWKMFISEITSFALWHDISLAEAADQCCAGGISWPWWQFARSVA